MKRKIILAIGLIAIIGVIGFSLYTSKISNKNLNADNTTATSTADVATATIDGSPYTTGTLTPEEQDAQDATLVFQNGLWAGWNVKDTKNFDTNSLKSYCTDNCIIRMKATAYTDFSNVSLKDFQILKVIIGKDSNTGKSGYAIFYKSNVVLNGKADILQNTNETDFATAWVQKNDDGKYVVDNFTEPNITSLDQIQPEP